jgi:HSP20 family protein
MTTMLTRREPFLMRSDPLHELDDFRRRLWGAFGDGEEPEGNGKMSLAAADWAPTVDIVEDEKEFVIKADLPEVKKEEVHVTVDSGLLTISGERKMESETKEKKIHRVERSYGSYSRSFRLPESVNADKLNAGFKDGVLTVHLPKSEEKRPRELEIKIS